MDLYIGIDLGTSAVKLLLVDGEGNIRNSVTREYPLIMPRPGWSEQDPADWWNAVKEGIKELTAGEDPAQVKGIGAGGQMHGLVVLDENGSVIRPAILWNDGRTSEEVRYLNEEIGRSRLSDMTGNIAFAGFTAPKLLWMKKHEPENFARIDKIMLPKDYINYMLTGVHSCDYSDASGTLLLDVEHRCWSEEMLGICGISRKQLPKLYESFGTAGCITAQTAEMFGFSSDVRVAAGAGDNAAAAVGTGTVGNGRCNISLGTSGTVFIASDSFGTDPGNGLHAFAHADGKYHLMGCMVSAASCNKWWCGDILGTGDFASEQTDIADDDLGRNRVFFLPYLMGERSPINDTNARGTFTGLSMDTKRKDMMQAVLEGVSFAIRDNVEAARSAGVIIESSGLCGGGARSPLWRKILANVLGIELSIPAAEEGPGYGGAMLAMVCCGRYKDVKECADALVRVSQTVRPDPDISARYEEKYRQFRKIYPAMKDLFPELM